MAEERLHPSSAVRDESLPEHAESSPPDATGPAESDWPTSFAQQRLWFLDQLDPGNPAYNDQVAVSLIGPLNIEALQAALSEIVRRHEMLRTRFAIREGEPRQIVSPAAPVRLTRLDFETLSPEERQAEALRVASREAEHRFELSTGPLIRTILIRLASEEHVLILTMHHIVTDGWSKGVLFRELAHLYGSLSRGEPSSLPELPIQYRDFASWQREWMRGNALHSQLSYWTARLGGRLPVLELPTDRPRPKNPSFKGMRQSLLIPREAATALKALGFDYGTTLYMTLLAAFEVLVHRYTGQEDIVLGTTITGRTHVETEDLIGFFVNLLVLRTDVSGNPRFCDLLQRVREVALGAYAHQELPFERLVEELRPERAMGRNPLVQVLFVMQKLPWSEVAFPGLEATPLEPPTEVARFDLAVFVSESPAGILVNWVYDSVLFDASTISTFARRYERLLASVIENPQTRLEDLEWLDASEKPSPRGRRNEHLHAHASRLRSTSRKIIDVSRIDVRVRTLGASERLPLILEPSDQAVDLTEWSRTERGFLESKLREDGALLFRDFRVETASDFERFASALCPNLFGEYGDLPREAVGGKVYGSTPYPPDQPIPFHNESSHMHRWPMKIWFFCVTAAQQGGETPIVDCRRVLEKLDPRLRERFAEKGLIYVRNYTESLDVSWQSFYGTEDRHRVEELCRRSGTEWEWTRENGLRTRQRCPAVIRHPQTGELSFFNQLQLHHVSCLEPAVRESLRSMLSEEDLPRNVYYGDGSPIEDSVMAELGGAYRDCAVTFPWQTGDILMLDNMLVAHSRNPYIGPRKVLVAMGDMINQSDLRE
ncbi:MAG TPA: condensation domain-containing protein [Thermoanaerobaculia bacterium]|nr:condensation domain-containing protein [Thermoanaerobaculia bacterium]